MVAEKQSQAQKPDETSAEVKKETIPDSGIKESSKEGSFKKPLPPNKDQSDSEEQKPVVKSEVTDNPSDESEQAKPEDATLILSAEEEAEIGAQTNEDAVKKPSTKAATATKATKKKKIIQKNVWVSNISSSTKAADLKKLFSANFKVESAKIMTNRKSFFGYICLESPEMAQKSVKDLDGSDLAGKKITVSLVRPDLCSSKPSSSDSRRNREPRRDSRVSNGAKKNEKADGEEVAKGDEKKEVDGAEADKDAKESADEQKKEDPEEEKMRLRRKEMRTNRVIQDLKTDLKRVTTELQNNRRRLTEANRRLETERDRKVGMRRELETLGGQLKTERRKFAQDLEQMEKKRKLDEIRYQDDRTILNRELDECRKLREYLQRKVDDIGISRHGRSPPRRSGPGGRGPQDRGADKMSRARMHSSDNRGARSPPPAPKINSRRSPRDRSPYKGGKKPRLDEGPRPFGNNHYQGAAPFSGGAKTPLLSYHPPSGSAGGPMYASTSYPQQQRYGSSGYPSGGYSMNNPVPLMGRSMGYPNVRGSAAGPRKY